MELYLHYSVGLQGVCGDDSTFWFYVKVNGRDSSVSTATRYGLEGEGIECRWGRDNPHPSRPALGAHPASSTMVIECFPGLRRPGLDVDNPPPLSPRLKTEKSYIYSPSGPS